MDFIANTDEQRRQMLKEIGLDRDDLFADIPAELRCQSLNIDSGRTEQEVHRRIDALAAGNDTAVTYFLGGGFYDHYVPAAVDAVVSRSEFYTAYTPYQPESSQGTLQAIYEYQSAICQLTEMEAANASLYDGGTAIFEAVMMALRISRRRVILLDQAVHPVYRAMLRTHTRNIDVEIVEIPPKDGLADREVFSAHLSEKTAALVLANPNFFGCVDDLSDLAEAAHEQKALLIASCYPMSLGLIRPPGAMGADIVVGEGQSLGLGLSFGGPYLGFMATRSKYIRKMPGRIAGRTEDADGRDGYVLTLQAREQHIRRDKATSNICTNQGLCALTALVYLSLLGKQGFLETARCCAERAAYAAERLSNLRGVNLCFPKASFFNEFVLDLPRPAGEVAAKLLDEHIAVGPPLDRWYPEMPNSMLLAVTEQRTPEQIDELARRLEDAL